MSNSFCKSCNREQESPKVEFCDYCGQPTSASEIDVFSDPTNVATNFHDGVDGERNVIAAELDKARSIPASTIQQLGDQSKYQNLGIVFGTSSEVAFWGLDTQASRLTNAYHAALTNLKYQALLLKADEVVGVSVALNNSTGSSAALGGSSEAVMLIGTAIRYKK